MRVIIEPIVLVLVGERNVGYYCDWEEAGERKGENFFTPLTEEDAQDPVKTAAADQHVRGKIRERFKSGYTFYTHFVL